MNYTSIDISEKLKIQKQNQKAFRERYLIENTDYCKIKIGSRTFYQYTKSGFQKLKNRKKLKNNLKGIDITK